jgi:hypothetical protein
MPMMEWNEKSTEPESKKPKPAKKPAMKKSMAKKPTPVKN